MHAKKTGALITASVLMGAACGNPSDDDWDALTQAGRAIGLAFQIQDDILDETAPTETLGKTQGRDKMLGKSTFPSLPRAQSERTRGLCVGGNCSGSPCASGRRHHHVRTISAIKRGANELMPSMTLFHTIPGERPPIPYWKRFTRLMIYAY